MSLIIRRSASEIARGLWTEILVAAGVDRRLLSKKEGPCPICGGNTRFVYWDKKQGKNSDQNPDGLSYCHHCGGRNGLMLLKDHLGLSTADAYRWIEDWYYGAEMVGKPIQLVRPEEPQTKTPEEIQREAEETKQKHQRCWQQGKSVSKSDPVWKYLCNRIPGFHEGMISPAIRFHPRLPYYEGRECIGHYPAMLAFVTAPNGECQDIHRTYLTMDGEKADVPNPKKTLASYGVFGGAIHLSKPRGNVLGVSEGIETGYAAEMMKEMPVWPLLNTSNMAYFMPPPHIKFLHIFEDHDPANKHGVKVGSKAAASLQVRAQQVGVVVFRHMAATVGFDFLNLHETRVGLR